MNESRRSFRDNPWMVTIIGGAIAAIIAAAAIGVWKGASHPEPTPSPGPSSTGTQSTLNSASYPLSVQQGWMNDCEGNNNSQAKCQCELTYFEQHASSQQFEQDYSAMPPGVVPSQLAGAAGQCAGE